MGYKYTIIQIYELKILKALTVCQNGFPFSRERQKSETIKLHDKDFTPF